MGNWFYEHYCHRSNVSPLSSWCQLLLNLLLQTCFFLLFSCFSLKYSPSYNPAILPYTAPNTTLLFLTLGLFLSMVFQNVKAAFYSTNWALNCLKHSQMLWIIFNIKKGPWSVVIITAYKVWFHFHWLGTFWEFFWDLLFCISIIILSFCCYG